MKTRWEAALQVHFFDDRAEDGIVLPHHIKVESDGKFLEEFKMKTCRVNPSEVTASDFRTPRNPAGKAK